MNIYARYGGWVVGSLLCAVSLFSYAHAASEDVILQMLIGGDTTPPSIPTGLTATGVSISQVDLSWSPSTDDYILSGYHVWRDGALIATTSTTTYSDVGLASSTAYAYYVTAYDSYANESASSTVATGTTLTPPPPATPDATGPQQGTRLTPLQEQIEWIEILPGRDSAVIRYRTDGHTRAVIKWGRTTSYESGSIAEQIFSKGHETHITGLIPDTRYEFLIEGEDKFGRRGTMYVGSFVTLPLNDTFPPANVTQLTATQDGDDIVLSWVNPHDPDFAYVRVVRSDRFYPVDAVDGWVVYEGSETDVRDRGAAVGSWQFYTVFSYDTLGNMSGGAVVSVRVDGGDSDTSTSTDAVEPGKPDPDKNEITLSFGDIMFVQEGERIPVQGNTVTVDGSKRLTISIPYERVPEHLKTIMVTMRDQGDDNLVFRFLLRVDAEHTVYTSTLAPLTVSGAFPITLTVFDYTTAQIGYASGTIDSYIQNLGPRADVGGNTTFGAYILSSIRSYVVWFIIALLALAFLGRRLMHAEW